MARALAVRFGDDPEIVVSLQPLNPDAPEKDRVQLERRCHTQGLDVLLFVAPKHYKEHQEMVATLRHSVNVICLFDRPEEGFMPDCGWVISDEIKGHAMAMRHLVDIGCREILLITHGGATHLEECCLEAAGRTTVHVHLDSPSHDGYAEGVADCIRRHPGIDGIFGFGDWRIATMLPALRKMACKIPHNIALVGYGDTPWSSVLDVPLTSVNSRPKELAEAAYDMVVREAFGERHVISPKLVIRNSTADFGTTL